MKNLIFAVIGIVIGVLVYTQMQKADEPTTTTSTQAASQTAAQASPTIEMPAELISKAADNAAVFILEPGDGATVSSPVLVKFGITNMAVVPAGDNTDHSGHHHILIDQTELPDMTQPIPATEEIVHFGLGQTETSLDLTPGVHTLQLLLGNYLHIPHDKPVLSKKITITVE